MDTYFTSFKEYVERIKDYMYLMIASMLEKGEVSYTDLVTECLNSDKQNNNEKKNLPSDFNNPFDKFSLEINYTPRCVPADVINKCIKPLEQVGKIKLETSAWGQNELKENDLSGTSPTTTDMFPNSAGWNNYGGPQYHIYLNSSLLVTVDFCQSVWNDNDTTSFEWEQRSFSFKIVKNETEVLEELYNVIFGKKIITHFINKKLHDYLSETAYGSAQKILSGFIPVKNNIHNQN